MLPEHYKWLANEPAPKMILEALKLFGTKELNGTANCPDILAWADELGGTVKRDYNADAVAWCGLFMAIVAKRGEKEVVVNPLWARNWLKFGTSIAKPELGDVLVFERGAGGHVGLYVGEDFEAYHVLGGNQGDCVCITRVKKSRLLCGRKPLYRIGQPANVRRINLSPIGAISMNEG